MTFSMGVATYERAPTSIEELIDAADALMYAVKQNNKGDVRYSVVEPGEG